MADCISRGGCVSDYIAVGISFFVLLIVLCGICFIIVKRRNLELNKRNVSVLLVQACGSLLYLVGVLFSKDYFRLSRKHFWDNCYVAVWLEGPFGFGLLLSCYVIQVYRLYYVFIARRLPPVKPYHLMPLMLSPWLLIAGVMQGFKALSGNCTPATGWWIALTMLHVVYPVILLSGAWKVRHVRFKFNEFRELVNVALICGFLLVVWGAVTVVERVQRSDRKDNRFELASRFIVLNVANVFVLSLFLFPLAKPVSQLLGERMKEQEKYSTMGQALGVPHSGLVTQHPAGFDFNRPLEFLLEERKFRESFSAFADRRLAAEVVHFYNEVRELSKLHTTQVVQRVYLAEHIIDKYIKSGAPMEINLSCNMRMEIMNTRDLADPDLFKRAVNEALRMMQMNLLNDYWQSEYFQQLKEVIEADIEAQYGNGLEYSVGVGTTDNPFGKNGQSI